MGQRLGQHFLKSEKAQRRIADAILSSHPQTLIEIGPGRGAITQHLAGKVPRLVGLELDAQLAAHLRAAFHAVEGFSVQEGNVLEQDLTAFGPATVCGNLPYYITSPIIEKTLAMGPLLERAVFLIQREPADRIVSPPGSRTYGYFSALVQVQAEAKLLFTLKPGVFHPPPQVDSAVIELRPRPLMDPAELEPFLRFASWCFSSKRKTLRNNLLPHSTREWLEAHPHAQTRAEALSPQQLIHLFREWQQQGRHAA